MEDLYRKRRGPTQQPDGNGCISDRPERDAALSRFAGPHPSNKAARDERACLDGPVRSTSGLQQPQQVRRSEWRRDARSRRMGSVCPFSGCLKRSWAWQYNFLIFVGPLAKHFPHYAVLTLTAHEQTDSCNRFCRTIKNHPQLLRTRRRGLAARFSEVSLGGITGERFPSSNRDVAYGQ